MHFLTEIRPNYIFYEKYMKEEQWAEEYDYQFQSKYILEN